MILSDAAILAAIEAGDIVIDPFDPDCIGTNSYDVHLGPVLRTYRLFDDNEWQADSLRPIDPREEPRMTDHCCCAEHGFVLQPGVLYLGSTIEYTETHVHVPYLDGTSSAGRLGISIHATAGRGDVGFRNHWTMEISCVQPVLVFAGMPIGQLTYHTVRGSVLNPYSLKSSTTYGRAPRDPLPQPSGMWKKLKKLREKTQP